MCCQYAQNCIRHRLIAGRGIDFVYYRAENSTADWLRQEENAICFHKISWFSTISVGSYSLLQVGSTNRYVA